MWEDKYKLQFKPDQHPSRNNFVQHTLYEVIRYVQPTSPCAYIANSDGTVSVIETAADKVIATINVGADPQGVAVTANGTKVYVTNGGSNNVSVIDTATNTVVASVNVGNYPQSAAASPDGKYVYVANIVV